MNWTWFPEDISKSGHVVDQLFYLALSLTTVAFVAVLGILFYFLIRYRSGANPKAHYTKGDSRPALVLTLTLAILVFILIDLNLAFHDDEAWSVLWKKPGAGQALEILVEPEQFAWNATYAGADGVIGTADDVKTLNDVHIPVNRPIVIDLRSKDVIHSFFLPNFRIKQDAVPGIVTHLTFEAVKTGNYEIACAEHCGLGHYRMRGALTVHTPEEFDAWLSQNAPKENA